MNTTRQSRLTMGCWDTPLISNSIQLHQWDVKHLLGIPHPFAAHGQTTAWRQYTWGQRWITFARSKCGSPTHLLHASPIRYGGSWPISRIHLCYSRTIPLSTPLQGHDPTPVTMAPTWLDETSSNQSSESALSLDLDP